MLNYKAELSMKRLFQLNSHILFACLEEQTSSELWYKGVKKYCWITWLCAVTLPAMLPYARMYLWWLFVLNLEFLYFLLASLEVQNHLQRVLLQILCMEEPLLTVSWSNSSRCRCFLTNAVSTQPQRALLMYSIQLKDFKRVKITPNLYLLWY